MPIQSSLTPSILPVSPDSHRYLLYRQLHMPDLDSLIRLACFPSLPDTDLGLGFLSLGGVLVAGSFTVRAVVFTVVVGCPGVRHYQKLLDVPLKGRQTSVKSEQVHCYWQRSVLCIYDYR